MPFTTSIVADEVDKKREKDIADEIARRKKSKEEKS